MFTRALTPEEYGLYPLYVSFMSLFTIVITLELSGNMIYRGLSKYRGREDEFISCTLGIICTMFTLVIILLLLFGDLFSDFTGLGGDILIFLASQVFFCGVVNLYLAKCRYFYEYKAVSGINTALALLSPVLSFMLINFTRVRATARIIAPLAVTGLIAMPLGALIVMRGKRLFSREIWGFILRVDLPLLPHFLSTAVIAQSGKIIVGRYFGEGALAKYSVVFSMGFVFSLITAGINSALTPWVNRKLASENGDKIAEVIEPAFTLFALMTLCGLCFSPEGLAFLAPREYREALGAIYPLSISVLVGFLTTIINAVLLFCNRSHLISAASIITACVNLILGLTLTARYGYIAAALVQLVSALILFLISAVMVGGVSQKPILNPKACLTVLGLVGVGSVLLYLLRAAVISRALIFAALVMLALPVALRCKSLIIEKKA
jgi:O-antigen/teichoic acid export membrane protein